MSIFNKIFSSENAVSDGWTQPQREALVDLLVLAMYTDNTLSLSEDSMLQNQVDSFQWDSSTSVEFYVDSAISRVRDIRGNEESVDGMLQHISERLDTFEARQTAEGICGRLLSSDGNDESEKAFFAKVQSVLKTH